MSKLRITCLILFLIPILLTCELSGITVNLENKDLQEGLEINKDLLNSTQIQPYAEISGKNNQSNHYELRETDPQSILDYYNAYHLTNYSMTDLADLNQGVDLGSLEPSDILRFPWDLPETELRSYVDKKNENIKLKPNLVKNFIYFDQRRYDNIPYREGFMDNYGCVPVSVAISLSNLDSQQTYYVEDIADWTNGERKPMSFFMAMVGARGFRVEFSMNPKFIVYKLKKAARDSKPIMVITYGEKIGEWVDNPPHSSRIGTAICQPFYSDSHVIVISEIIEDDGQQFLFTLDPNDPNNNRYWDSKIVFDGAILFYIISKNEQSVL